MNTPALKEDKRTSSTPSRQDSGEQIQSARKSPLLVSAATEKRQIQSSHAVHSIDMRQKEDNNSSEGMQRRVRRVSLLSNNIKTSENFLLEEEQEKPNS